MTDEATSPEAKFTTADELLEILIYPAKVNPTTKEVEVDVEIQTAWPASPPIPIQETIAFGKKAAVQHADEDDPPHTVDGTLSLGATSTGRLAVFADLSYGAAHTLHHFDGVMALIESPSNT